MTNYGLGGLCEAHIDPVGYFNGQELVPEKKHVVAAGDYIATLMAWLKDAPKMGGGTAFLNNKCEH